MAKFDISALSGFDMSSASDAPTFRCLPEGEYEATVDAIELTVSKTSGKPMFIVDYLVDDGEGGEVALRDYVVLAFASGTRNPRFKQMIAATGGNASKASMTAADLKAACTAIGTKLPGRSAVLSLKVQEGRPKPDGGSYPERNNVQAVRYAAAADPMAGLEL